MFSNHLLRLRIANCEGKTALHYASAHIQATELVPVLLQHILAEHDAATIGLLLDAVNSKSVLTLSRVLLDRLQSFALGKKHHCIFVVTKATIRPCKPCLKQEQVRMELPQLHKLRCMLQ